MTPLPTVTEPISQARKALRRAFVARLVKRMRQSGVLDALFSVSFGLDAMTVSPPHLCASGVLHATLKPLCRSGVAAGGAGGGGPGTARSKVYLPNAATVLPLAA